MTKPQTSQPKTRTIRIGKRKIPLPRSRIARLVLGVLFVLGGLAGSILPVLGVWMVPLGLLILSVDLPAAQRLKVWLNRKLVSLRQKWRSKKAQWKKGK